MNARLIQLAIGAALCLDYWYPQRFAPVVGCIFILQALLSLVVQIVALRSGGGQSVHDVPPLATESVAETEYRPLSSQGGDGYPAGHIIITTHPLSDRGH